MKMKPERNTLTLSDGTEVSIRAVPKPMIEFMNASRNIPKTPTYVIETGSGETQEIEYDSDSIKEASDAEKERFGKYMIEASVEVSEYSAKFLRLILSEGIYVSDELLSDDARWYKRHVNFLKLNVPNDIDERKYYYITTELIRYEEDTGEVLASIMEISGTNAEAVEIIRKSFRRAVQESRHQPLPDEIKQLVD